ncbi:MAG: DUF4395 domain-containing protein [Prolixibacteraceae bacterium]
MQNVCPITDKRIDEKVSRLNAFFTVIFVALFVAFDFWGGLVFLMVDFMIRGFIDSKYSPICQLNKWLGKYFNLPKKLINAGPKIFAAQVGLVLTIVSLIAYAFGCGVFCIIIAGMLGVFSFLESAFGYCVACKLYPFIRRN